MGQELYNQLLRSMRRLHNQMHRLAVSDLDKEDLQPGQARALRMLYHNDGVTQRELADLLVIRPASMTHLLQRLEEQGFILRKPNPEDKRSMNVYLTEEGWAQAEKTETDRSDSAEALFSVLSTEEQQQLQHTLSKLEVEWERMSDQTVDYLLLFLWLEHFLSEEMVEEWLTEEDIDYRMYKETKDTYQKQDTFAEEWPNHPYLGPCGQPKGAGRGSDWGGGYGHPHGAYGKGQGRGMHHGGPQAYHGGGMGHGPARGHGPSHQGRPENGRARMHEMHRARHRMIRSGFDLEGLRADLERMGITHDVLKRLVETGEEQLHQE